MDAPGAVPTQKPHRASRTKKKKTSSGTGGKKNAVAKPGAFARRVRLAADRSEKRAVNPFAPVDRTHGDAAPRIVAVVGPTGVGKSTIIRNLVKHYSKRNLPTVTGPITLVSGCRKRLTFLEIGSHLASMIDAAKIADLVLLVIDAGFGFEMETFEFLNIAAAHGMPKVITILTHLDKLRDGRQVRRAKKAFKDRIWAELYDGAKVFFLSGITTSGDYLSREILNLARFISVSKFPVLRWRAEHPYILADRVEDISSQSLSPNANRTVAAYGYVRGTALRPAGGEWRIHLAGVSDLIASKIEPLPDPCPPPESGTDPRQTTNDSLKQRRKVSERERILHAPMAPEVDGIAYERDAVYISLNPENIRFSEKSTLVHDSLNEQDEGGQSDESSDGEGEKMVKTLQDIDVAPVDDSLRRAELKLIEGGKPLISENFEIRKRRPAVFDRNNFEHDINDSDASESSGEEEFRTSAPGTGGAENRSRPQGFSELKADKDLGEPGFKEEVSEEGFEGDTNGLKHESVNQTLQHRRPSREGVDDAGTSSSEGHQSGENEDDVNESAAERWKDLILRKAENNIRSSVSSSKALTKFIYDKDDNGEYSSLKSNQSIQKDIADSNDGEDEFFRPRRRRFESEYEKVGNEVSIPVSVLDDTTRLLPNFVRDWVLDETLCKRLKRKRWGTGQKYRLENEEQEEAEDENSESPVDGDFEDLETGEVRVSVANQSDHENNEGDSDFRSNDDIEAIRAEKIRQKERFDEEWDRNGRKKGTQDSDGEEGPGVGKERAPAGKSRKASRGEAEREPDFRKLDRENAERLRNEELQYMDSESRMAVEGILPGQYVRLELHNVPVEFVKYFDPNCPTILGGLRQADDEGQTYLRARIRRHRFKRGVLKSNDPVVFSIGWRRFQSIPVYDTEDPNGRRRYLKYTPEFLHCNATFWGPRVAPGAGLVMCQSLGRERAGFRLGASGVLTEVDTAMKIVKKLKLVGEAARVHRNTAFIKGMFNSELEAAKYVGAAIRTVSGVRGTIKKAISEAAQHGGLDRTLARAPPGTFRATFEDRILLSDLVFLRAWVPVDVEKFFSVAATLLDEERDGSGTSTWRMRTVREIREAKGLAIPLQQDSLYQDVERGKPVFAPLRIPKAIEGSLPYASKTKDMAPLGKNRRLSKPKRERIGERKLNVYKERAVITDLKERKERQLLQAVYNIRKERSVKLKETKSAKLAEKVKAWKREESKRDENSKVHKKRKHALEGARDARKAKRSRVDGGDGDANG